MSEDASPLLRLEAILRETGGVAVAFSAGVDSAFLLKVAHDVLGERAIAVTAKSRLLPAREFAAAESLCGSIGVRHIVAEFDPFAADGFAENPPDRCYRCKRALLGAVVDAARVAGFETVVEGSNLDDEGDYRPGMKAIRELGIRSPLREAGLGKVLIREYSRKMGLATWNKPSFACLASRLAYGETITEERLRAVERAEEILFAAVPGLRQGRVRLHGEDARIEVEEADISRVIAARAALLRDLSALGFAHVSLDLAGYRTGSMNQGINQP